MVDFAVVLLPQWGRLPLLSMRVGTQAWLLAPPNYPQFFAAVQAAVRQWTYSPLVRSVPGEEDTALHFNGWSVTYSGKATAMPFHQDYDIVFTQGGDIDSPMHQHLADL